MTLWPAILFTAALSLNAAAAAGQALRAEAVYSEAEALCTAPELQLVRLRLQYMHADHLIRNSQYVKAESLLRDSLAIENGRQQKSSLYVAVLQSLAFLREQQGDVDGAETLLPDGNGVSSPGSLFSKIRSGHHFL